MDAEGDETVVGIIGQGIENHGENHNDILASLLHGEEWNDVIGQVFPSKTLKQYPADAQLQREANEETAYKKEEFASKVVLGLEYPVAVPQEAVDDTKDIAHHI